MRRIWLRIIGLICISLIQISGLNAQSIKLYHHNIVQSNDSVYIDGSPGDIIISSRLTIENVSNSSLNVKVKRTELLLVDFTINYFCWGACYTPETNISPFAISIPAGQFDSTSFFGDYMPNGNIGTSVIMYTFFVEGNEQDSASVTIFYQTLPSGENKLEYKKFSAEIFPNPVFNDLKIRLSSSVNNFLKGNIISLDGKIVKSINFSPDKHILKWNMSEMRNGLYIFELLEKNRILLRKKVLIAN